MTDMTDSTWSDVAAIEAKLDDYRQLKHALAAELGLPLTATNAEVVRRVAALRRTAMITPDRQRTVIPPEDAIYARLEDIETGQRTIAAQLEQLDREHQRLVRAMRGAPGGPRC